MTAEGTLSMEGAIEAVRYMTELTRLVPWTEKVRAANIRALILRNWGLFNHETLSAAIDVIYTQIIDF